MGQLAVNDSEVIDSVHSAYDALEEGFVLSFHHLHDIIPEISFRSENVENTRAALAQHGRTEDLAGLRYAILREEEGLIIARRRVIHALLCVTVHFCFLEICNMWLEQDFEDEDDWEGRCADIFEVVLGEIDAVNRVLSRPE